MPDNVGYRNAEAYRRVLQENEINCSEVETRGAGTDDERYVVEFGMSTDSTKIRILSIFTDDTVANRVFSVAKIPDDKTGNVLFVLNEMNDKYRFTKFYLDSDNEVTLSSDAILQSESSGNETFRLVYSIIRMVDDVYPRIMKELWGGN